jgi:hypothetical protein
MVGASKPKTPSLRPVTDNAERGVDHKKKNAEDCKYAFTKLLTKGKSNPYEYDSTSC